VCMTLTGIAPASKTWHVGRHDNPSAECRLCLRARRLSQRTSSRRWSLLVHVR